MTAVSVRLPDDLLKEADAAAKRLKVARSDYIRMAVSRMNREIESEARRRRLAVASERVRNESMRVNAEFDTIEYGGKAR